MRTGSRVIGQAGLVLSLILTVGACESSTPVTATPGVSAPEVSSAATHATIGPSLPAAQASAPSGSGTTRVVVDATLLRLLPASVGGVALEPDPTTAEQITADPSLAESADAIAVALAIRPGTSTGDDLAIASVIRLRPGIFSDAWFETWRTTYDASACDVAGGVKGSPSQVVIAGRTVYVGTCAGDAKTYHVHLGDAGLIVSVTAAGAAHFGELVMAGLAE